jgi:tRNA pseudouridine55 synthase
MSAPAVRAVTDGLTIVDKPAGMTSHDVVARIRRLARTRRVGHAGTLDPMATGVLVVAVGRATRLLNHLDLDAKSYAARIRLGESTTTDDAEGELLLRTDASALTDAQIEVARDGFVGEILQVPSSVSAIKINGERAYKRVRAGETVELAARPVTVTRFDILAITRAGVGVDVDVEVDCSSGTYIRALARDLGTALSVGGHLTRLRRLRVGRFDLTQARTLEQLAELDDPVTLPMAAAVRAALPVREVSAAELTELSYGRALAAGAPTADGAIYAAIGPDGMVAALLQDEDGQARPVLVFAAR